MLNNIIEATLQAAGVAAMFIVAGAFTLTATFLIVPILMIIFGAH